MSGGRLALVLGSGTARGLAHIGVLKVCERECVPIDLVVGTSIGALIGGAYACGVSPLEMEKIACAMDFRRLVSLADMARFTRALVNGRRVERFIRDLVGNRTFADTRVPFACVAVDLVGGQEIVLREGDLAGAIRASMSTPIVFAPVELDGRLLVDGAVMNPVPVDAAHMMGAQAVVAVTNLGIPRADLPVFCNGRHSPGATEIDEMAPAVPRVVRSRTTSFVTSRLRAPAVYQLATGSVDLMQRQLSESRLEAADLVIAPLVDAHAYYGFCEAEKMIAAGEQAAEAAIGELRRLTGPGTAACRRAADGATTAAGHA